MYTKKNTHYIKGTIYKEKYGSMHGHTLLSKKSGEVLIHIDFADANDGYWSNVRNWHLVLVKEINSNNEILNRKFK